MNVFKNESEMEKYKIIYFHIEPHFTAKNYFVQQFCTFSVEISIYLSFCTYNFENTEISIIGRDFSQHNLFC